MAQFQNLDNHQTLRVSSTHRSHICSQTRHTWLCSAPPPPSQAPILSHLCIGTHRTPHVTFIYATTQVTQSRKDSQDPSIHAVSHIHTHEPLQRLHYARQRDRLADRRGTDSHPEEGAPDTSLGWLRGIKPGQGWRPHTPTPALRVSPSSWHLCLGLCVSLGLCLSPRVPVSAQTSLGLRPARGTVSVGGGEGASPGKWEPQCHAPRLPNSAGRGKREDRGKTAMRTQSSGCSPNLCGGPAPPFRDPKRWRRCRGRRGRQREGETSREGAETERGRQRDRER